VQRDVLLCDEPRADTCAQVLLEKVRDNVGRNVVSRLEKATRQHWDCVGVVLNQVGERVGEARLFRDGADLAVEER
jgi:adenosyl cobinamide kinase/adenosyl cobinamide phosphate guanylyltransferase